RLVEISRNNLGLFREVYRFTDDVIPSLIQLHDNGRMWNGIRFNPDVHPIAHCHGVRRLDVLRTELSLDSAIIGLAVIRKHLIPTTGRLGDEGPHPTTALCAEALPTILAKVGKKRHNIPIFVSTPIR